jgi:hypothetical protein
MAAKMQIRSADSAKIHRKTLKTNTGTGPDNHK